MTAFPLAREASPIAGGVNGHTAQPFVQTSPQSWAETDIKGLLTTGKVSLDESKGDKKGPITLGSAVSPPRPRRRAAQAGRSPSRRSRKRASWWSATPTSPPTARSASRATAISS